MQWIRPINSSKILLLLLAASSRAPSAMSQWTPMKAYQAPRSQFDRSPYIGSSMHGLMSQRWIEIFVDDFDVRQTGSLSSERACQDASKVIEHYSLPALGQALEGRRIVSSSLTPSQMMAAALGYEQRFIILKDQDA